MEVTLSFVTFLGVIKENSTHERTKLITYFIKIKIICCMKYNVNRMKMQATNGEKYFQKSIYDKVLAAKIHKKKINHEKTKKKLKDEQKI